MLLNYTMELGSNVAKAAFAAPGMKFRDQSFLVAGWGHKSTAEQNVRNLRGAMMPIYWKDCQRFYGKRILDNKRHFCLGYDDRATKTAYGDQGGPVFSNSLRVVYGIIVNGEGNTISIEGGYRPMLMAYIAPVREWIDKIYEENGQKL